ncbi:Leucine rich repeat variant [Arthrobacter sp. yr096]|uniref:HEAT repeat domain-containing protein n=1 Tax=Arthrobacter sp. yr096 TaxID=1761750 RepID=UPI0008AED17C|nr:hypothetical protein [Arthrobacter sp. yr096]SEI96313.1 Leucine rich repeat variant [Arthrobacter sp. yr096]
MSLTSLLRDPQSPERAYLDRVSPLLEASGGHGDGARAAAEALGLTQLATSVTVVSPFPGADPRLAGTAFDFRARIELGGFKPHQSVAADGVALLDALAPLIENGGHRTRILAEAFDVAAILLQEPSNDPDLDRAAILLAYCEQVARTGAVAINGSLGSACDQAVDGRALADGVDPGALANLRSLVASNGDQFEAWQEQIAAGVRYEPNPQFAGSHLVDGADADWMIEQTLIDCKVYGTLTVGKLRDFLRQLLGYVMLDTDDSLGIRSVGLWLPRQRLAPTWSLTHLLGGDSEELLPTLREGFIKATTQTQLARHEPVPEKRRHQYLADNRHTTFHMLEKLASNEDPDLRRRVGRNESTPEQTVRTLAGDGSWHVRQGVATNRNAPEDVLEALARDRSVAVRRAAASNPRAPQPQRKAVASGINRYSDMDARTADRPDALNKAENTEALADSALDLSRVHIDQNRDESALDTRWFSDLLFMVVWGKPQLPIPKESYRWGWQTGRTLCVEDWMQAGLPDDVLTDLLRPDRPAWVREVAASELPLSDPAMRSSLLNDPDPAIRWSTLERTVTCQGADLTALLGSLGASREERLRFRTSGLGARRDWPYTAAEYERQTLRVIAAHASTPYSMLLFLMEGSPPEVLASLIENPTLKAEDRDRLAGSLQASRSVSVRAMLASLNSVPATALNDLAADKDTVVREAVAQHHATPPSALIRLAKDPQRTVQLSVLNNPASTPELARSVAESLLQADLDEDLHEVLGVIGERADIDVPSSVVEDALDRLSKSRRRDPDMRLVVAGDERAGRKTLSRLGRSTDDSVRREVGSNPSASDAVIELLAGDTEPSVRASVAANPRIPVPVLERLASDREPRVRAKVAVHRSLPQIVLIRLLNDPDDSVRTAAMENPAAPDELVREVKAELELAPEQTRHNRAALEQKVAHRKAEVRMSVAFSPDADADLLRMLGGERRSAQVRRAVAANPNTPVAVLRELADDDNDQVRQAVAFNGATPADLLIDLASNSVDLAVLVAMNPDVPQDVLRALSQDTNPLVRFVAAGYLQSRLVVSVEKTPIGRTLDSGLDQTVSVAGFADVPDPFPPRHFT